MIKAYSILIAAIIGPTNNDLGCPIVICFNPSLPGYEIEKALEVMANNLRKNGHLGLKIITHEEGEMN